MIAKSYPINDKISLHIPTLGEILGDEIIHYNIVQNLIATPYDMVVEFEEWGIDYFEVDEFRLFSEIFMGLKNHDTSLIFDNLDISGFQLFNYKDSEELFLYSQKQDIIIDKKVQQEIANAIGKIYSLKKSTKKIANAWALEAIVDRTRQKRNINKRKGNKPYLENLLVRMVNKEGFKYNFETSMDLNIYAFNKCVESIQVIQNYELTMQGIYSGSINYKDLKDKESLNWLS